MREAGIQFLCESVTSKYCSVRSGTEYHSVDLLTGFILMTLQTRQNYNMQVTQSVYSLNVYKIISKNLKTYAQKEDFASISIMVATCK